MEISIIIIASLTLICAAVGLFLINKSHKRLSKQLNVFEEKMSQDITLIKEDLKREISINFDDTKNTLKNFIADVTQKSNSELKLKIEGVDNSVSIFKEETKNTLRAIQQDIVNHKTETIQSFEKASVEMKLKVDEVLNETANKFNKIIDKINEPLPLD